jgi:hypothetical protein
MARLPLAYAHSSSCLTSFNTLPREIGSTELAEVFRSSRRICQVVPTARLRGYSCLVGAIKPIETHDRDQVGGRCHENERTSQYSIFLMFVLHNLFFESFRLRRILLRALLALPLQI